MTQSNPNDSELAQWVYERLAGALECCARSAIRDRAARRELLARVRTAIQPPGTRTVRATDGAWGALAPGVAIKLLRLDRYTDNMTAFIRMEPGAMFGAHHHAQTEECLVIEGEVFIGAHCLRAGDMHVAPAGTEHARVTSPHGALMLVRGQAC